MSEFVQNDGENVQESPSSTQQRIVVQQTESYVQKAAGFWIRFWAYTVDLLVLSSIGMLLVKPIFRLFSIDINNPSWYAPISIVTAVIFYLYFVLMTKFFAQTIGKMIFGIRVIPKNKGKLTWGNVIFREWIGRLISIIPFNLPYIVAAFTPKKQAIHDYIADTLVVHENTYDKKEKVSYKQVPVANELQETNEF
ncbi:MULTISPECIES: RDD family protein [Psychrobacillus]|uniref:RDD family protein n=1 Tax=Psychrobacillus faecigallinarum TaxID=2762235 RepID=A0ABR8R6Y5_9BACI|nr:RDD family protein [Psychrobacillus faecigallinarum]MBD7943548.1 RDD family protein [Psychrobacillus faecigallinarum]